MILDVSINDALLELLQALSCLSRHVEVVANNTLLRQVLDDLVVALLDDSLDSVLLREQMANQRWKFL